MKAKPARGYIARLLLISGMCSVMSGWFLYDGYVTYPEENRVYETWKQFKDEKGEEANSESWNARIEEAKAADNAADPFFDMPKMPATADHMGTARTETDILTQKLLGYGLLPLALLSTGYMLLFLRRWIAADEEAITAWGGVRIPYEAIAELDKTRWRSKGIANVVYEDGEAQIKKRLTLDDWKFQQAPTQEILRKIESKIDEEKITGGVSEAEFERQQEEAEREAAEEAARLEAEAAAAESESDSQGASADATDAKDDEQAKA